MSCCNVPQLEVLNLNPSPPICSSLRLVDITDISIIYSGLQSLRESSFFGSPCVASNIILQLYYTDTCIRWPGLSYITSSTSLLRSRHSQPSLDIQAYHMSPSWSSKIKSKMSGRFKLVDFWMRADPSSFSNVCRWADSRPARTGPVC